MHAHAAEPCPGLARVGQRHTAGPIYGRAAVSAIVMHETYRLRPICFFLSSPLFLLFDPDRYCFLPYLLLCFSPSFLKFVGGGADAVEVPPVVFVVDATFDIEQMAQLRRSIKVECGGGGGEGERGRREGGGGGGRRRCS